MNRYKTYSVAVLTILLLISLCISCDTESGSKIKQVTIEKSGKTLTPTRVIELNEENLLLSPVRILNLNNEYLIISEMRQEDIFQVYALPELNFLYSWGGIGRGPDQLLSMPYYIQTENSNLIVYEGMKRELIHFQVNDTSLKYLKKSSLSFEGQTQPLNRIKRINDTLFFADYSTLEETDFEHVALKPGTDTLLFLFGKYPDSDLESIDREFHFSKSNTSNPIGSKFAAFYTKHNKFKIYDNKGDLLKDVDIKDQNLLSEDLNNDDFMYRSAIWGSDDYIYTIGYNGSREQIFEDFDETVQTLVEVWNWEGEFINRVKFDRLIHNFTVSEEFRKVYAFSYLHEDKIFEYNLDDVFEVQ